MIISVMIVKKEDLRLYIKQISDIEVIFCVILPIGQKIYWINCNEMTIPKMKLFKFTVSYIKTLSPRGAPVSLSGFNILCSCAARVICMKLTRNPRLINVNRLE